MSSTLDSHWDSSNDYCTRITHYIDRHDWWSEGLQTLEHFFGDEKGLEDGGSQDEKLDELMDGLERCVVVNGLGLGESLIKVTALEEQRRAQVEEERMLDQTQQSVDLPDASPIAHHTAPTDGPGLPEQSHHLAPSDQVDEETLNKGIHISTQVSSPAQQPESDDLYSLFNEELTSDDVPFTSQVDKSGTEVPSNHHDTTTDPCSFFDTRGDAAIRSSQLPLGSNVIATDDSSHDGHSVSVSHGMDQSTLDVDLTSNAVRKALSSTPCPTSQNQGSGISSRINLPSTSQSSGRPFVRQVPEPDVEATSSFIANIISAHARSLDAQPQKPVRDPGSPVSLAAKPATLIDDGPAQEVAYGSPFDLPNPYSDEPNPFDATHNTGSTGLAQINKNISVDTTGPVLTHHQQEELGHTTSQPEGLEILDSVDNATTVEPDTRSNPIIEPVQEAQDSLAVLARTQHDSKSSNDIPMDSDATQLQDLTSIASQDFEPDIIISSPVTSPFKLRKWKDKNITFAGSPTKRRLFDTPIPVLEEFASKAGELLPQPQSLLSTEKSLEENQVERDITKKRKAWFAPHPDEPPQRKRCLDAGGSEQHDTEPAIAEVEGSIIQTPDTSTETVAKAVEDVAVKEEEQCNVSETKNRATAVADIIILDDTPEPSAPEPTPKHITPIKPTNKGKATSRKDPSSPDELALPHSPTPRKRSSLSLAKPNKPNPTSGTKPSTSTTPTVNKVSKKGPIKSVIATDAKGRRSVGSRELAGMFNSPPRKASDKTLVELKGRLRSSTPRAESLAPAVPFKASGLGRDGAKNKKTKARGNDVAAASAEVPENEVDGDAEDIVMGDTLSANNLEQSDNKGIDDHTVINKEIDHNGQADPTNETSTQGKRNPRPKGSHPITPFELEALGEMLPLKSRRTATPVPSKLGITKPTTTKAVPTYYAPTTTSSAKAATRSNAATKAPTRSTRATAAKHEAAKSAPSRTVPSRAASKTGAASKPVPKTGTTKPPAAAKPTPATKGATKTGTVSKPAAKTEDATKAKAAAKPTPATNRFSLANSPTARKSAGAMKTLSGNKAKAKVSYRDDGADDNSVQGDLDDDTNAGVEDDRDGDGDGGGEDGGHGESGAEETGKGVKRKRIGDSPVKVRASKRLATVAGDA